MNKKFLIRLIVSSLLIPLIFTFFLPTSGVSAAVLASGTAIIRSTRFSLANWDKNLYLDVNAACDSGALVTMRTPDYKYQDARFSKSPLNGNWHVELFDLKPRTTYLLEIWCTGNPVNGHILYWHYTISFSGGTIRAVRTSISEQGK